MPQTGLRSQSGSVSFGIVFPEVIALCIRIGDMRRTDAQHLLAYLGVSQQCGTQSRPVGALAPPDDVVDGSKGQFVVGEVTMQHGSFSKTSFGQVFLL